MAGGRVSLTEFDARVKMLERQHKILMGEIAEPSDASAGPGGTAATSSGGRRPIGATTDQEPISNARSTKATTANAESASPHPAVLDWLVTGLTPIVKSPQWWNYLSLTLCLSLVLWLGIVNLTMSISSIRIATPTLASFADWAINAPPILGVVGTVIAFSGFISASAGSVISGEMFSKAFFDAAATTVVGGLIYVINLLVYATFSARLSGHGPSSAPTRTAEDAPA